MYPINIGYRLLSNKAVITIHPIEIDHLELTLETGMYEPCADFHRLEPRIRSIKNIFRLAPVKQLLKEILKWKSSGKLWVIQKNEPGMDVRISVEVAIIMYEICEASNSPSLHRLKGNIHLHLTEKFNIQLTETVRPSTAENEDDYSFFFDLS